MNPLNNEWELYSSCTSGHKDPILLMIKNGVLFKFNQEIINDGLGLACQYGHMDIVLLLITVGANSWNRGLICSCYGGHKEIALLMIKNGANDWEAGLWQACYHRHKDLILLMVEHGANINNSWVFTEFDIDYLLSTGKIKDFGRYTTTVNLIKERRRRILAEQIFKELYLRDVDGIICSY